MKGKYDIPDSKLSKARVTAWNFEKKEFDSSYFESTKNDELVKLIITNFAQENITAEDAKDILKATEELIGIFSRIVTEVEENKFDCSSEDITKKDELVDFIINKFAHENINTNNAKEILERTRELIGVYSKVMPIDFL